MSMEDDDDDVETELTPLEWPEAGSRELLRVSTPPRDSVRARESASAVSWPPSCRHSCGREEGRQLPQAKLRCTETVCNRFSPLLSAS